MTPYETAVLLAARGLIAVPLYPVGPDGLCTCGWASCEGRHVRHHAGKHVRPVPGFGAAAPPLSWWRHQADTPAGIDRRASRVVTAEDDGDLAAWARAERMPLPPTFTLASPRRRLRLFYRLPEGFGPARSMVQVDGWQVDIIAWVSAPGPGVRNSEGEYRLVRDVPVAPRRRRCWRTWRTTATGRAPRSGRETGACCWRQPSAVRDGSGRRGTGTRVADARRRLRHRAPRCPVQAAGRSAPSPVTLTAWRGSGMPGQSPDVRRIS